MPVEWNAMSQERQASFGPNAWLVDEMYEQYRADPSSVTESWRDFFADYRTDATPAPVEPADAGRRRRPNPAPKADASDVKPLRGGAARLVANMEASLAVPTATSARAVPARLLEVNRKVLNGYMSRTGGNKVSFTHLIGYAVVRALDAVPGHAVGLRGGRQRPGRRLPPAPRRPGPGHRRGQVRRHPHPARPLHPRRRHAGLRRLPRRLRGHRPPGAQQQDRPPRTSPASP